MGELMDTILHRRSHPALCAPPDCRRSPAGNPAGRAVRPQRRGRQGPLFVVCQDQQVNQRLGKIKRANSRPRMATAENYVSREQPSIADNPRLTNAFYDAPTVITLFGPKGFLFSPEDCLHCGSCYESCPVQAIERMGTL